MIKTYCAPMEGVTDFTWRRLHKRWFSGTDRYYTPFIATTKNRVFSPKEFRECMPENNGDVPLVPQLLGRDAEDFLWTAERLRELGHEEINLNLGCPSGTVTGKGKGSGLLLEPEILDRFLNDIFEAYPGKISIKTRLGFRDPEEFPALLRIYNQYPVCELTLHPRTRQEQYRGPIHRDWFEYALRESRAPLCYNGGLTDAAKIAELETRYPDLPAAMIGQGLLADPSLLRHFHGGPPVNKTELQGFFTDLYETYTQVFGSAANALSRMKGLWHYARGLFQNGDRLTREIARAKYPADYETLVRALFAEAELKKL